GDPINRRFDFRCRLGFGDVALALANACEGFLAAAHRQLHAVDAARAPFNAANADGGIEQTEMMILDRWAPGILCPGLISEVVFRLGNSCDPPGFRESSTEVPARFFQPYLIRTHMQTLHINGYDMAYLEVGQGKAGNPPLVCVHSTLGDFRTWYAVLGPLS